MKLTNLTREDVKNLADNGRIFASGEEYRQSGMIFRFSAMPTGLTAQVHGNYGNYTVTVTPDVKLRCTCPYEGTVCKHMVAVLLHYLDNRDEWENAESPAKSRKAAALTPLEQTLTKMPEGELRTVILRLSRDNAEVRRALLETVVIAPELLTAQPTDAKQVKSLKKAVDKALKYASKHGYDNDYDDSEQQVDLKFVFDATLMLNPDDQAEVLWYIVEQGNAALEEAEYDLSTEFIEEALGLYGRAVVLLQLPAGESKYYLDTLIEGRHWPMCDYGDVAEAVQEALAVIASDPDDVRYLIHRLESSEKAQIRDWAITLYRKIGDAAGYLKAREANLDTEAQYLELAEFFDAQGDSDKSLETLEAWITRQSELPQQTPFAYYWPNPATGRGQVLRQLITRYEAASDAENLCRILMFQARQEGVTLKLYQQVQAAAEKLGQWADCRPELFTRSRGIERARIYLHEEEWMEAIALARMPGADESVQALVAGAVQEELPYEAITLYDALVQSKIRQANRQGYHVAAQYAAKVKYIYLEIVKDASMAALYLADIRRENARRPALREEFAKL